MGLHAVNKMRIRFIPKPPRTEVPFAIGIPALIWQALFFYIPLSFIVISSFLKVSDIGRIEGLTLSHIQMFLSPTYLKVILASLLLALSNATLCFLVAYPLAYFLAFTAGKYSYLFLFLLIVPFWTNFLLHVYAWFYILEKHGFINNLLMKIHLITEPLHMLNSLPAVMIMMVYYYLPFMILPIYASLDRFNYRLIEASYDLGGSFFATFKRILLPITSRGIRAGFFLVFIPSFGEFVIPELMGGDKKMFVGTVVSQYILGEGTGSLGSAFTLLSGIILIISSIALYIAITKLLQPRMRHG
ncbi:MAG: Putrescine transport system permease protein PotH [Chlamydiae bacterium]|nr:Putrescine transport system permease protein PotH [Chlamydiota bacterium]